MPKLHKYIGDEGLHLPNFIVTTSVCCPSRVSLLTGKYTHNHNVTSNQNPTGGYRKFVEFDLDREWLPTLLKPQGYNTYFTGKFINLYDVSAGDVLNCPKGWDMFDPLTDATVYDYFNYEFTPNCGAAETFTNVYQTDTIQERSLRYIDDAVSKGAPFYLQINPAACHTACPKGSEEGGKCTPPIPAPKYRGKMAGASVPRSSNFFKYLPSILGVGDDTLNDRGVDQHYQLRLETMMSIDDLIEALVLKLEAVGQLDNTYIMYTSDNGYHLGNHAISKGKTLPYEEDIRVPFYMRGPGIPGGVVSPYMATMVDLTASFVQLAGGAVPDRFDGIPLPLDRIAVKSGERINTWPNFPNTPSTPLRQMLPVEMWINSLNRNIDKKTYRTIRVCTNFTVANDGRTETCWKYTVWCIFPTSTNYKELFDLGVDPGEINNLLPLDGSNPNMQRLLNRLDALLQVMGYCKGATCRQPWLKLHPNGRVNSFEEAMNPAFDGQYESYTKFAWRTCSQFYNPWNHEVADPDLGGVSRWVT